MPNPRLHPTVPGPSCDLPLSQRDEDLALLPYMIWRPFSLAEALYMNGDLW
jgi:hypothetical protein